MERLLSLALAVALDRKHGIRVFEAETHRFMRVGDDPAVDKLASQMMSSDHRKKPFEEGKENTIDNLNVDVLEQEFKKLAQPGLEM